MHRRVSVFLVLLLWASILGAENFSWAQDHCSSEYLLQNDEGYSSEASYTVLETCRLQLGAELRAKPGLTVEDRYLLAKLSRDYREAAPQYVQLCEREGYLRACSAAATMVAHGVFGDMERDFRRFLDPAAEGGVPAAQVTLGDAYLIEFKETRNPATLCTAIAWWSRADRTGDTGARKRLDWSAANFGSPCKAM